MILFGGARLRHSASGTRGRGAALRQLSHGQHRHWASSSTTNGCSITSGELHPSKCKYGRPAGRTFASNAWAAAGRSTARCAATFNGARADLSATPFCNTLPIRRSGRRLGRSSLDTVYVDAADLSVVRSRQRYLRQSRDIIRYIDLAPPLALRPNWSSMRTALCRSIAICSSGFM